jgi:RNA polymerase sigma factor (sigma-70 family)
MSEPSLLDIVRRCQKNPQDRQAFDLFYRAFYPYVRLYVRVFRLPITSVSDEDLIQDIFLKLMERFPEVRFNNEGHFLGYLKVVCEHYVIDMIRKYERQTYEELTHELKLVAQGDSAEQAAAKVERHEHLVELIGRIPGICQATLLAFLEEGLSLVEISRRQNIALGTIYPRFSRCVRELRRQLALNNDSC